MSNKSNDGVVYTKAWVVDLMLDMVGFTADKPLWKMRAIEPSCGEGSFLRRMAERIAGSAIKDGALDAEALFGCVGAFEVDGYSANAARRAVRDVLTKHGMSEHDAFSVAKKWVSQGDYLLAEPMAADFVVGNPPYVRATDQSIEARRAYCSRYETMTMGSDLYVAFIERGIKDLRDGGRLCYICADRWLHNQYGKALRGLVAKDRRLEAVVEMHDVDAFEKKVSAYPAVALLGEGSDQARYAHCNASFTGESAAELLQWLASDGQDHSSRDFEAGLVPTPVDSSVIPLAGPGRARTVLELSSRYPTLEGSGVELGIGLATGRDSVFITDNKDLVEPDRLLPIFIMRDWRKGDRSKERWMVNPWNEDGSLIDLEEYPRTREYLERNFETLAARHVAKQHPDKWFRTIDRPRRGLMGRPMLLFPDMAGKSEPVYSDGSKYPSHNCSWLTSNVWDLKVLGGLLMSDLAESFIEANCVKMRGGALRFQPQYLRSIHVPRYEDLDRSVCDRLRKAFENEDRAAASEAARLAYGV